MVIYSNFIELNNNEARINSIDPEAVVVITSRMCACVFIVVGVIVATSHNREADRAERRHTNQPKWLLLFIYLRLHRVREIRNASTVQSSGIRFGRPNAALRSK